MKYAKCCICGLEWNVSCKNKNTKDYSCPECEERRRRSIGVRSVLLKNKKRYGGC